MKKILALAALAASFALTGNAFAGGNIAAGKIAAEKFACAACHGADYTNSPIDSSYPKLAGQHQDYLVHALTSYKRGGDGPNGRANAIMGAQVQPLTRQDMENIAAYLHSLSGALVVRR